MRARLALASAGIPCELREILLRDKAPELLQSSPKGTVPVLVTDTEVIDESLDIMLCALGRNDPEGWLDMPDTGLELIARSDSEFKPNLDAYKYKDDTAARTRAATFLHELDARLSPNLFGARPKLADMAILTFVRQFAFVDKPWFDAQDWPNLSNWLQDFITSSRFATIMQKYPKWQAGDSPTLFPGGNIH
ncbi:glutathione S-transferase [Profundibacter amoris]|uniref:Glutathione S-transferase n=2 Tax=Profundibacter amoris TaxID=2171755 RepID=A0A347ULB2_9RHOB|nr:glutathione S-transferase [Profundibacter amoris]